MKIYRISIILAIIVLLCSCRDNSIKNIFDKHYFESLRSIDSTLVNHFPDTLPEFYAFGTTLPKNDTLPFIGFGCDKIELWYLVSKLQMNEYISKFNEFSVYSSNDSALMLVFSYTDTIAMDGYVFRNQASPKKKYLAQHNITTASSLPVPLFNIDEFKGNTISGLSEDFEIYVIDAQPGKFMDEEELQDSDCLPKKWKHGFSKGIALSEEQLVIIYWVIVW